MEKIVLTGWEITINQNGVKMATLNHERFISYLKYVEWLEEQVKLCNKPAVINNEVAACDHYFQTMKGRNGKIIYLPCEFCGVIKQADL